MDVDVDLDFLAPSQHVLNVQNAPPPAILRQPSLRLAELLGERDALRGRGLSPGAGAEGAGPFADEEGGGAVAAGYVSRGGVSEFGEFGTGDLRDDFE